MNDLRAQVRRARRRLLAQQFFLVLVKSLAVGLLLAAAGITVRKFWAVPFSGTVWMWSWIGGSLGLALLAALAWTVWRGPRWLDAAMELDRRFGLKERVSSSLALTPVQQQSEAGQALLQDAQRRVAQVDVKSHFPITPQRAWMPLAALGVLLGVSLLSDAESKTADPSQVQTVQVKQRVQNSSESLKKKLAERKQQAMQQGLKEAETLFDKLEQGVDRLANRDDVDRKKAMIELNDLAKDLKQRKAELGNRDDIRKQLQQLKNLSSGPAERFARAMQQGDFQAALEEVKKMQQELAKGEMSEGDRQQLQEQLSQLQEKLQQLADAHQQAKEQLQKQIEQKLAQGDREAAAKLQQQLDQLQQQNPQMDRLSQMAQQLGQCAECMSQGKMADAASQLESLSEGLGQMQQELEELELLEDALDQIAQAKDSMNCGNCQGMGCSLCQGQGMGQMSSQYGGMGMGEGRGQGDRPEEETSTGFYDSQVRSKPGRGRAVVTGIAPGPNKAGEAREEIKSLLDGALQTEDDPLTTQRLPRAQRELARDYFDAFREGR